MSPYPFSPEKSYRTTGSIASKRSNRYANGRRARKIRAATDFDRGRIISLREAGWSNRRIGRHLGRSDMVVARVGNSGSQKVECTVAEGQDVPGTQMIARIVQSEEGYFGTNNVASIRSTPLTSFQTSSAIKRNHKETTDRSWLEEPTLSDDDHRTRVWRRTGQRSDPAFIVERHTAISQGVTVWGAISWDTRSSLVVLQGTLTAHRYVDDILTPIVLPMLSSRPGAIYQQDNARPHTARLSQQCLQGYDVLPWPARSPDLFRQ
ncbi:HTH_Tnp_Tc3_2 domain-containing protein [Trichonephila clavipes]|nr:HTH_Tnp_Tc3_2 domain-containing protein [Trichonephila clavipes]